MEFRELELGLATFLSAKIGNPKIEVIAIPENESEFDKIFGKEKIIVAFSDEEPEPTIKSTSTVYQNTDVTFAFLIQSKSLRGTDDKLGIYAIHRLIKKYLIGYKPEKSSAFSYAGFKMQDKINDIFNYAVYFKTKGFVVQETDNEDLPINLLKQVTYV